MRLAVKRLDMAAAKGVIHKNQAARRKSRLMKKINTGVQPASRSAALTRRGCCVRQSRLSRATSTSITSSSGHSLAPRRSRSAWASSPIARTTPALPSLRY